MLASPPVGLSVTEVNGAALSHSYQFNAVNYSLEQEQVGFSWDRSGTFLQ